MLEEETYSSYRLHARNSTPEQECRGTELRALIHTKIKALPTRLRHVAEDRFYVDLSLNALAEKRQIGVTAAKSRLFRARRLISEGLIRASAVHQGRDRKEFS
jgi:DNA-directed RNA polymerase specialized sigma24 family protein